MNIDKLVGICTQFPDVRVMAIGDEQLEENYNTGYGSWRGSYDEPALFFNGEGYITLKDLIPYLDKLASGDEFEGYKGVLFSYSWYSPIHFENSGECYNDNDLIKYIHPDDINEDLIAYLR